MSAPLSTDDAARLAAEARRELAAGRRAAALSLLHRAAALLHAQGALEPLRGVLAEISQAHLQAADFAGALQASLARVRLALSVDDPRMHARAQAGVGLCQLLMGQYDDARTQLRTAAEAARALGDAELEAMQCNNLVWLAVCVCDGHRRAGHEAEARVALLQAEPDLRRAEALGFGARGRDQALWRANRSAWLRRMGRLDEAQQGYAWAYGRAVAAPWVDVARHTALGLAQIALQHDGGRAQSRAEAPDPARDEACRWLVRCIAQSAQPDPLGLVNEALHLLARRLRDAGRPEAAQRHLAHSAQLQDALQAQRRALAEAVASARFDLELVKL